MKKSMLNTENIYAFINFNFKPFKKSECIMQLFFIWLLNIPFYFLGTHAIWFGSVISLVNVIISSYLIIQIKKYSDLKETRFLCDGITFSYIAVILNLLSYKVLSIGVEVSWVLSLLFIILLFLSISLFWTLVYKFVKEGRYNSKQAIGKVSYLPFLGASGGILVARLFLQNVSQNSAFIIISMCLLVLSFLVGICSAGLIKFFFLKKVGDTSDSSVSMGKN